MAQKRRTDAARTRDARQHALGAFVGRSLHTLVRALPLLLIFGGLIFATRSLWQRGLHAPTYLIAGDTISLRGSQQLIPEAVKELRRLGHAAKGRSLLDPYLLRDVRRTYEASAWIHSVHALRRNYPNRVAIEFDLRTPVAQVRQASRTEPVGRYWLVDQDGILLPVPGALHPRRDLPLIVGTTVSAIGGRPDNGEKWQDTGVTEALALLQTIQNSPLSEDLHIRVIRINSPFFLNRLRNKRKSRPRYYLETTEGVDIRWGEFNNGDFDTEKMNSEKIADLRHFVAQGYVDSLYKSVDVSTRLATCSRRRRAD